MSTTMALLPRRGRGGFPPDIEAVVNTRWTEAILVENGLDVARLRLIGVDICTLASCVSLQLVDVEVLRDNGGLKALDVSRFNEGLQHLSERATAIHAHPGDLLGQCYHQQQLEDGSRLCSCDVEA